jgi:hypothetical protein
MVTLLSIIPSAFAVEPSAGTRDQIEHLLTYLEQSGCEFFRNGEWYGAAKAKDRLNEKHSYLQKKNLIGEAEDFVRAGRSKEQCQGQALPGQVPREQADSKRDLAQRGIVAVQRAEARQEVRVSGRAAR